MTYIFRPSHYNATDAEQARVYEPGGALPWWNPDGATPGGVGGACVGAYQAKGAASYAASLVNLANPGTNDLIFGGPPLPAPQEVPWAALTGWGFVVANAQYFDTGFVAQNDQSQSVLVQFANKVAGNYSFGALDVNARFFINHNGLVDIRYCNGTGNGIVAPGIASGNVGIAGNRAYRNGADEGVALAIYSGIPIQPAYIGALNNGGAPAAYIGADILLVAIYNVTLTAPQVLARATAMAAL